MKKYNMMVPEGTRDILPDECREIRLVQRKLMEIFLKVKQSILRSQSMQKVLLVVVLMDKLSKEVGQNF